MARIKWRDEPESDDYPSAESFLRLIYGRKGARHLVRALKRGETEDFKVIDILRASREPLLDVTNSHVKDNHNKILAGKKLSPPLLVADPRVGRVIIADGYHRVCAAFSFDEDAEMPCRITVAHGS
jgi:hypothetical protein